MEFLQSEQAKELLDAFLKEHIKYVKTDLTSTDIEVMSQRSRFYKLWCYCVYAHIYKKGGNTCLRCGKIKQE